MSIGNFFQNVTVSGPSFSTTPDVTITLTGKRSCTFVNEGSGTIEYSFDGTTLHGNMIANTTTAALVFDNRRISTVWFRLASGSSSNVRVEAWTSF